MFGVNIKVILLVPYKMFYRQTKPVDSISGLRFAIGLTVIMIYSKELLYIEYQLQSKIRY